jgi:hypothetical protein
MTAYAPCSVASIERASAGSSAHSQIHRLPGFATPGRRREDVNTTSGAPALSAAARAICTFPRRRLARIAGGAGWPRQAMMAVAGMMDTI